MLMRGVQLCGRSACGGRSSTMSSTWSWRCRSRRSIIVLRAVVRHLLSRRAEEPYPRLVRWRELGDMLIRRSARQLHELDLDLALLAQRQSGGRQGAVILVIVIVRPREAIQIGRELERVNSCLACRPALTA